MLSKGKDGDKNCQQKYKIHFKNVTGFAELEELLKKLKFSKSIKMKNSWMEKLCKRCGCEHLILSEMMWMLNNFVNNWQPRGCKYINPDNLKIVI